MDLSGAFLDTNRLLRPLQRRLHAAWCELRGETALTVPSAGWELARTLDFSSPETMAESRHRLSLRLGAGVNNLRARVEKLLRIHKWWADVWLADDSPYEIHFLSPDQQDKALLGHGSWSTPPIQAHRHPAISAHLMPKITNGYGGADGIRTRDLRRDRPIF